MVVHCFSPGIKFDQYSVCFSILSLIILCLIIREQRREENHIISNRDTDINNNNNKELKSKSKLEIGWVGKGERGKGKGDGGGEE